MRIRQHCLQGAMLLGCLQESGGKVILLKVQLRMLGLLLYSVCIVLQSGVVGVAALNGY